MKCKDCGVGIPVKVRIGGRILRTSCGRKKCYKCSPWGLPKERVCDSTDGECQKHPLSDWKIDSKGYRRCRQCCVSAVMDKRRRNMQMLKSIFGGRCFICGYSKSAMSMDFHHMDPSSKEFSIGSSSSLSFSKLLAEAKKCILLCKNCHAEVENGITVLSEECRSQVAQLVERLTVSDCSFRG